MSQHGYHFFPFAIFYVPGMVIHISYPESHAFPKLQRKVQRFFGARTIRRIFLRFSGHAVNLHTAADPIQDFLFHFINFPVQICVIHSISSSYPFHFKWKNNPSSYLFSSTSSRKASAFSRFGVFFAIQIQTGSYSIPASFFNHLLSSRTNAFSRTSFPYSS